MWAAQPLFSLILTSLTLLSGAQLNATEIEREKTILPTQIKAVIFDCDGVLVDTEYLKYSAWKEALSQHGVTLSLDEYAPLVGHTRRRILSSLERSKKVSLPETVLTVQNNLYSHLQREGVAPIDPAISLVQRLSQEGAKSGLKLALASSASRAEISCNLKQIGLENVFTVIVSGRDDLAAYKDDEGTNKPKPYIYIEAARQLGVDPSQCLTFEDTSAGITAAAGAGTIAIAVPNQLTKQHDFSQASLILDSLDGLFDNTNRPIDLLFSNNVGGQKTQDTSSNDIDK